MAPLRYLSSRQVLVIYLVLFLFASSLVCSSYRSDFRPQKAGRRVLLETENEDVVIVKKKPSSNINGFSAAKNQTKLLKQHLQKKEDDQQTKKNQTKILKPSTDSAKIDKPPKKLNSTAKSFNSTKTMSGGATIVQLKKKLNSTSKALNSTKSSSGAASKKPTDLLKPSAPKNKTTIKPIVAKAQADEKLPVLESKTKKTEVKAAKPKSQKPAQPSWIEQEDDADLVSELRDLPFRFQQTLVPDLERISTTSRAYIFKANKEITRGFKPIVGNKYAPTIAPVISFAFILLPLLLVSLIFNKIKAYFSLQKILIFIQVYLSIYFSILCVSSLVTGLEPLRFFYSTSQSTYVWLQVLQTLGYVLYLLLLLMYLVLVFSTDCGLPSKLLGLAQTFVGFAIGLHYYVTVFHRVVLHQPPRTNWKVHGVYATFFLLICLFSGAERRKKAYLAEGGEEGKQS